MFWEILDDSKGAPANGSSTPCHLAQGFNEILHVRS
jgi:hypothetical protein